MKGAARTKSYPLRVGPAVREQVRLEAFKNHRSLNVEFGLLIEEALEARREKQQGQAKV